MVLDLILEGPIGFDKPISLTSVRQKIATAGPFSAIHVQISSGGGEADEAFDIYTLLRAQPVPVCATATGECYSGGLIIFMAGALRKAKAGAGFLMHPTSSDRDDALPDRITAQILQRHAEREISTEDPLNDTDAITSGIAHEIEGLTLSCSPAWPEAAERLAKDARDVYLPAHMLSQNYFTACRVAGAFFAPPLIAKTSERPPIQDEGKLRVLYA